MAELKEEEAVVANGVGPPEEKGPYVVNEVKDDEKGKGESEQEKEKEDDVGAEIEEEKGTEEKGAEEEKNKEENVAGTEMEEDVGKEDKITEDVGTTKDTDMKIEEAEDAKEEDKAPKEDDEEEKKVEEIEEEAVDEDEHSDGADMKVDESEEVKTPKEKRKRGWKPGMNGDKKEKKVSGTKEKESPRTTSSSTIDRPVRERRTVERLVEVIEEGPSRGFLIEKGRGTPFKDIPNVAYKLAGKRPADLKLLHQTLFGRRGKALNYRTHILQFSGFPWPKDDEKQRAKVKEKLDKFVKDMLVDFCDLFDIPVSKTGTKKEDLVVKLLDFMMAPHATTDVILAEKDQSSKSRKRKRVARSSGSKNAGTSGKTSRKKQNRGEGSASTKCRDAQETEDYEDEEDNESVSGEDKTHEHSGSEENEDESEEAEGDEDDDEDPRKSKQDKKTPRKQRSSRKKEKIKAEVTPKKAPRTAAKSPPKSLSSKHSVEETNDAGEKVFSRKKKTADVPEKRLSPKAVKKERSAGKRVPAGKGKSEGTKPSGPSKDELRKTICEILKEVDFNTATFTDILKKLAEHYKMDLTPRKLAIKLMIQKELTKLAEEAEENEVGDEEEDTDKGDNSKASGKKLEA